MTRDGMFGELGSGEGAGEPVAELDARYSAAGVSPTAWSDAAERLAEAEVFWLSTVRPDGRPHVTPLMALWLDDGLYFSTGPEERKARNLAHNPHCVLTTGRDTLEEGEDLVVEGEAARVTDPEVLRELAEAYVVKYGETWRHEVRDGALHLGGNTALAFRVAPVRAFGFAKGPEFGQTRWRF